MGYHCLITKQIEGKVSASIINRHNKNPALADVQKQKEKYIRPCSKLYPHILPSSKDVPKTPLMEKINEFSKNLSPVSHLIVEYLGYEKDLLDAVRQVDDNRFFYLSNLGIDWFDRYKNRQAVEIFSCKEVKIFRGIFVNTSLNHGDTPLMIAAETGQKEKVKSLLEHPEIGIDLSNKHGDTALTWASFHGNFDCVKYLVKNGVVIH